MTAARRAAPEWTLPKGAVVVVALDKFRGSLSAADAVDALAVGLRTARPDLLVSAVPVADGGEGTVAAALANGFLAQPIRVRGPLGEPAHAVIAVAGSRVVIEMAQASGLHLLPGPGASNETAVRATTFGTGELVSAALDAQARTVILGVGGSASTDGGAGMLQALGAQMRDSRGELIAPGFAHPLTIATVDLSGLDPRLKHIDLILATDVDNPLLGTRGAAAVFGPQKGADAATVQALDAALHRWVRLLADAGAAVDPSRPGAGAAGGVGFAAMGALGAVVRPGVDVVLELTELNALIADAALVITGEGSLDEQSLGGKTPVGVLRTAQAHGVPTIAVVGRTLLDETTVAATGFAEVISLRDRTADELTSMREAARLLTEVGYAIARRG